MKSQILEIINEQIKNNNLKITISEKSLDKNYRELNLDSLSLLSFIVACEEKLGYQLPDETFNKITTINELIKAFEDNKPKK
ncbi:hypothetical protein IJQ19_00200 [bacterium]|nr:hypothetical protein [bacterium]